MLDGLEAVEIPISTCQNIIDFRIDANTYKKEFLASDRLLMKMETQTIENISTSIQNFGAYSLCNFINFNDDDGIPFLMTKNIRENYIDWNIEKYVDEKSHEMLWKSHCHRGQVLVTMAGEYLGRVAVYNSDTVASSNQAIAKISLKDGQNPYMVSTFLNSKYGQHQIQRFKTITGQPNINMSLISSLKVPVFSQQFCEHIEYIMKRVDDVKQRAFDLYAEAEELLLEELGLNDFTPSNEYISVKNFSESFGTSGRLDSEFYQLKYDDIIGRIKSYHGGYDLVKNQFMQNKTSYEKTQDSYDYIEISDVNVSNGEITPNSVLVEELPANAKNKVAKGDILVSKVRPYRGAVGIIELEQEDLICSGAFTVLREHGNINKETLVVLFRLECYKDLLLKYNVGTSYPVIRDEDVLNIPIPLIDKTMQNIIAEKISESFTLRAESKKLLKEAKTVVERAIEQGE